MPISSPPRCLCQTTTALPTSDKPRHLTTAVAHADGDTNVIDAEHDGSAADKGSQLMIGKNATGWPPCLMGKPGPVMLQKGVAGPVVMKGGAPSTTEMQR